MWITYLVYIILFPLVGALLGWFTNFLAVKMLFHPKKPKTVLSFKVGKFQFKGITFHGIFPKRQKMIAMKIGKVVADELLSIDDIKEKVVTDDSLAKIYEQVEEKMNYFIDEKIPKKFPFLYRLAGKKKYELRDHMLEEVMIQLPEMMDKYIEHFEENLDIEEMISEKFSMLSSDRLEEVMNEILSKEFKFIEILGGVIGFIVGIVQAAIAIAMMYI
ncbi:MAG: uncharacterized membrane protein YheB (UPF0754 family) [Maribacter sp.]|jgi:uncharacterized membrane protein YheB (UPF0754 family)